MLAWHCSVSIATALHPLRVLSTYVRCVRWWNRSRNYRPIDFTSSAIRLRVARWASSTTVVTVCLRFPYPHHELSFAFFSSCHTAQSSLLGSLEGEVFRLSHPTPSPQPLHDAGSPYRARIGLTGSPSNLSPKVSSSQNSVAPSRASLSFPSSPVASMTICWER